MTKDKESGWIESQNYEDDVGCSSLLIRPSWGCQTRLKALAFNWKEPGRVGLQGGPLKSCPDKWENLKKQDGPYIYKGRASGCSKVSLFSANRVKVFIFFSFRCDSVWLCVCVANF